jgi:hypothetical protein
MHAHAPDAGSGCEGCDGVPGRIALLERARLTIVMGEEITQEPLAGGAYE